MHDVLGQFSMVNLELFNIVEEIKVSKSFVVYPKNVNAENATILPVMLSSKLLPELEIEDNSKREQLLHGMQDLPIPTQIDMLKSRIDAIAAACESAEKVLADTRKAYGLDTRPRLMTLSTLDKAQAAKIQEQENLLRAAVNHGEADILAVRDPVEPSGIYLKNTPPMSSVHAGNQGTSLQTAGPQVTGRSVPSPSAGTSAALFDNTTSPLPHANSPRSGTNMMNAQSPQQQMQQPQLMQQQLRQKMMQLPPHQQQLLTQQQLRQSAMQALGT
ncbi:Mediator of RNA polymerase II transcription subunit 8-like protein [Drosera capensis]